jgi:hypothetical protein
MDGFIDRLSRHLAASTTRRDTLRILAQALVGAVATACYLPTETTSGSGSSGGSSCPCRSGYAYNSLGGKCCPSDYPWYDAGGHGYSAGCYRSCPYVGDCSSSVRYC